MPATFSIDVQNKMVHSKATGVLNRADLQAYMDQLSGHPDFRPEFNQIADFRQVRDIALSNDEIRELAGRRIFAPKSRRAFLVADQLVFGLARMFATLREIGGEQGIRVFTDAKEARSWVSPPDAA
jgi:hypothetical protein